VEGVGGRLEEGRRAEVEAGHAIHTPLMLGVLPGEGLRSES